MDATTRLPSTKEMERARLKRDASYDGVFLVGVRTMMIFCRPSCPAKQPLPENVVYFASAPLAAQAGYRPCKRCRPERLNGHTPNWVRTLLAMMRRNPDRALRDSDLKSAGLEPSRARRFFRANFGMTFQAYQRAWRMGAALGKLRDGTDALAVGLETGYESASGFRAAFGRHFGVTPHSSGRVNCITVQWIDSPLGPFVVGATDHGVCLLEFADRRALPTELKRLAKSFDAAIVPGDHRHLKQMADQLAAYFDGSLRRFTVPLEVRGTPFQRRVWDRLRKIPFGQRLSYGQLADEIGSPGAQRAVGSANGANCIAVAVPCHRVVQSNGQLRGYGGGLWRKQFLLDHERRVLAGRET